MEDTRNRNRVYVEGLKETIVTSADDVFKLMDAGQKQRRVGVTNMNDRSSRSHTIFRIIIESMETVAPGEAEGDAAGISSFSWQACRM